MASSGSRTSATSTSPLGVFTVAVFTRVVRRTPESARLPAPLRTAPSRRRRVGLRRGRIRFARWGSAFVGWTARRRSQTCPCRGARATAAGRIRLRARRGAVPAAAEPPQPARAATTSRQPHPAIGSSSATSSPAIRLAGASAQPCRYPGGHARRGDRRGDSHAHSPPARDAQAGELAAAGPLRPGGRRGLRGQPDRVRPVRALREDRLPRGERRRVAGRGGQQLRAEPPLDVRRARRPRALPGAALLRGEPRGRGLQPAAADAARRGGGRRQGPRPGAGGGGVDAAELLGQQALELSRVQPEAPSGTYTLGFPLSEDSVAGDGHLRRQLRHGWQAADRAA